MNEKVIDISNHPIYKNYTKNDWVMWFIENRGQYDGGHHKQWCLDQIVRIIKGTPIVVKEYTRYNGDIDFDITTGESSAKYLAWVEHMLGDEDENGDYEYSYDEGIAP
jgi:hypothetical protein